MPSSPKSYALPYGRHPSPFVARRSTLSLLLISVLLILFLFAAVPYLTQIRHSGCADVHPRSVRVVWEHAGNANAAVAVGDGGRHKVMGFVGIQTGFGSAGRREALRKTWFPSDRQGLQRSYDGKLVKTKRQAQLDKAKGQAQLASLFQNTINVIVGSLEESTGLAFRFIIGRTSDRGKMSSLHKELAEYDDFILLDIQEEYSKLPYKTLAFFKAAYALFDAEFYVKADDDIYLRPDRLSLLLAKERSHPQTYIGCMKKGPVFTDPKLKCFRMFSNEDVTIGAWMLAMNVNHENNHELCATDCTATSVAVWDIPKCSGLCNPEKKMLELHQKETCSKTPTLESDDE
ncbi:beta-1,3-galactosyltransferase 14 [Vigna angularis]|uniref:Hexosyltransferase n=1 Tax=Phaseolus angularis TaxID=3914 RepID=A0A8T0KAW4_PHAAN|nr:beta-1,3-galactosyltransferase 14 [Vigna angularis]